MADSDNIVSLRVNDTDFRGWESVSVEHTIEAAASSFSLTLTESWPGQDDPIRVNPGDDCQVFVGDDLLLTGYVEVVTVEHSGQSHTVSVSGHSRTIDLVECSCVSDSGPLQFRNQTLLQIAQALADPYDVTVTSDLTGWTKIAKCIPEVDATPFAVIEKIAREKSVLVTDDPQGRLVLSQLADVRGDDLTHPGNILSCSGTFDATGRYTEYRVKGQRAGDDQSFGRDCAGASATIADDDDIPRRRVLTIKGERAMDSGACRRRAIWEAVTRAGKSVAVDVTVQGWRQSDGTLYAPNRLHAVNDAVVGVYADLLAVGVTFSIDGGGMLTTLRLAPPGAYFPEPPAERARSGKKKITAGVRATDPNWRRGRVVQ